MCCCLSPTSMGLTASFELCVRETETLLGNIVSRLYVKRDPTPSYVWIESNAVTRRKQQCACF